MSNTGFVSPFSNKHKNVVNRLEDIDFDQIKFGMPTKKGPATFIPVTYKGKPFKFQARGVSIGFVGHSNKKDALDTPLLDRSFYFSINAGVTECPYMTGNICDGPALLEFHKKVEEKFREYIKSSKELANKMKATYKERDETTNKPKLKIKSLIPLWTEETPITDSETGEETGEFYPPSVMYKLRPNTVAEKGSSNRVKVDSFTTTFKGRNGKELDIKPSNINGSIPRGSFGILNISMPRIWIGSKELKFTVYVNEAKLVIVDNVEDTDDFAIDDDEPSDEFKPENNNDIGDPDAELAALEEEAEDL